MTGSPRGGPDSGFTGMTDSGISAGRSDQQPDEQGQQEQPDQFAGMGPILEDADADVFRDTEEMIKRQELLKLNEWNQDEYYKTVVNGYPWATLEHDTTRDVYTFALPYGVSTLSIQPIPNKNLDLVNETSEQLLVDFPEPDAEPIDDSEEAEEAADLANRFLAQDSGEQGTNDAVLFDDRVKLALICSTSYVEYWTDPSGGGYVPLQIEAHPQAQSPDQPLIGPDGNTTTDLVLRYVTAPQGGQFTDDPTQAAPQWQPKLRASKWGREHLRVFPEHLPVDQADEVIVLGHCTLSEAKRRWQSVSDMAPEDLSSLCDWQPARYLVLLPPFQRARWKLSDGKTKNRSGSSDERIMFYYHRYVKARPDYPKGADVVMSGIDGGLVLDKKLLSVEVEVPKGQTERTKETRCREIPLVQVTPRGDPTGQNPTGTCYLSLFVGATESNATLGQGYAEALHKKLHTPFVSSSLSPISGVDVQNARDTGDILSVIRPEDVPKPMEPPLLDTSFFEMYQTSNEAIDRIAKRTQAASGDLQQAKERSGIAIQKAISQNSIGSNSMLTAVNNAVARGARIKLEIMMADFTTTQQVAYTGEDGANKVMDLHALDFALIGKVTIKAGTGTGLSQDGKVQYLGNLKAEQFITAEEATEAARPSFAKRLGLPPNPFEQYVSRCIDTWLNGPPEDDPTPDPMTGMPKPGWTQQYQAWLQAEQQYETAQAQYQQQQQAQQQYFASKAAMLAGPPSGALGPEAQTEQAGVDYQQASIAASMAEMQNPAIGQPLVPPQPPQVQKPWVPFSQRPNDTEPQLAGIWARKLSRIISSVDYDRWGPEWTDVLTRQYSTTRQAAAIGAAAQQNAPPSMNQPSRSKRPATPATQPSQPAQAAQPTHAPPPMAAGAR